MGLNCSPQQFQQRVKDNRWAGYHSGKCYSNPRLTPLDRNNSALSRQLPQQSRGDQRWEPDSGQSGYYSEDSDFDLVSMKSVTTSEASATRERQTKETFDRHTNQMITLPKLNDDSSTNDQWIWLADVKRYVVPHFGICPILKRCCTILEHLVLPHFKMVLPHFGTFIFSI